MMRIERQKFRIGELAKQLNVEQFIIRFWEKEFNLKPTRSSGNQRFYSQNDLKKFKTIKSLLYEQGFTIAGAKKRLKQTKYHEPHFPQHTLAAKKEPSLKKEHPSYKELMNRIVHLKKQLRQLQELL